jgi:Zn finger protein HypA/HybF involved in hydrogenase expression
MTKHQFVSLTLCAKCAMPELGTTFAYDTEEDYFLCPQCARDTGKVPKFLAVLVPDEAPTKTTRYDCQMCERALELAYMAAPGLCLQCRADGVLVEAFASTFANYLRTLRRS